LNALEAGMNAWRVALVALALARASGEVQIFASPQSDTGTANVTVRLEPHDGQTHFKIGDRMLVDLVFTSPPGGYTVETDDNPSQSVRDLINVVPDGGWFRSHTTLFGQGLNGNASVEVTSHPVRVPILLNRAITFRKPGHYEVMVKTERLFPSHWTTQNRSSTEECERCWNTNPLGIDIAEFDQAEEPGLVASLTREIDEAKPIAIPDVLTPEEKERIHHQLEAVQSESGSPEENQKKAEAMMQKVAEIMQKKEALMQSRELTRRVAAERLAYLAGDDAMRAKIRFISEATDQGDPDPVGFIMVNGLPSSRNLELQQLLLEKAWHDPLRAPTSILQSAMRQARELVRRGRVTDDQLQWAGTDEDRKIAQQAYQKDLNDIVASLPLRTGENRQRTIEYLTRAGMMPDQLNQQRTGTQ